MNKKIIVLLIASLTIFSCRQNQPDDHDHDHDEVKLMITAYSEEFEVFAEADPFVVGKTSAILAHFTHLHNFKPLQEGKITLSLIIGNRGIRQVVENPVKPGIYSFALQPEVAGTGRLVFELETGGKAYILEAIDITVFADEHTAIHAAEENSSDHPAAVSFTKEQSWVISFATDGVQSRPMGTIIKTVGEVLPAHGDEVLLTASANGIVNLTDNRLYEGAILSSGQSLLNISGAGLAEGNALQRFHEARNNYERARADYERLSELAKEKIVSERELLQARNEAANTKIIFDNISRNFSESGQIVRSPVSGFLKQLFVNNGQYVETGQPVATVAKNNNLIIRAEVQQRYAGYLNQINEAHITAPDGNTYTLQDLGGEIVAFARGANTQTHLLPVHIKISNPGNQWIQGSLVDVYFKSQSKEFSVAVPIGALIEEQGNFFVYVQIHPESFEKREVKVGVSDGLHAAILQGLEEGERIVSQGAIMVKIASSSGNIDPHSGHVH